VTRAPHSGRGVAGRAGVPPTRPWQQRLDDPEEPLYTVSVAADLLGVDAQTIRRLQLAALQSSARPSGNQRRYSRRDLEVLAAAAELSRDGIRAPANGRILELEREVRTQQDERATP
jgi:MerR family transcriptional regulator/heat shock protein HspR